MTEFSDQVQEYIENDRQWPRQHRISHAKMMMDKAPSDMSRNFWRAVLKRNED